MRDSLLYQKMHDLLSAGFEALPDKPEETVASTLDTLWSLAAGNRLVVEEAEQQTLPELNSDQQTHLSAFIEQNISGIPLAHLTGLKRFMDVDLEVTADALIPRKETELVGYGALGLIQKIAEENGAVVVLDICTGAGNLGLAFAYHEPKAKVFGSDLSDGAFQLAARNATNLELSDRVEFRAGDLLEPFRSDDFLGKVDVLTCNPPYISSGKLDSMPKEIIEHEPEMAFNGGPFGISILSRLIKQAPEFVKSGGWLAFEVGAGQGPGVQRMLERNPNYGEVQPVTDGDDQIRAILTQLS